MQAKKNIAVIGLGDNQKNLHQALLSSDSIELVAVCDKNPDAIGRRYYSDIPFYSNYRELADVEGLDFVYISVDPQHHFEIAKFFLDIGIAVLCEKPPTSNLEEYLVLIEMSRSTGTFFNVVYHFRYSNEALWLKEHLGEFGRLIFSEATFYDPYFVEGEIIDGREALGGCWMDSASNILSVWSGLFPSLNPHPEGFTFEQALESRLPVKAISVFSDGEATFSIHIEWVECFRGKRMGFLFEDAYVLLDFTAQAVFVNGEMVECFGTDRATPHHYLNFFNHFEDFLSESQNIEMTKFLYLPEAISHSYEK